MLNAETKRHIDAARQVLVGVVPNPSSQIEQITTALIYKFMDDIDQSSINAGGKPDFFVGPLEKYSWTKLMDSRLENQGKMNLYTEALQAFSESKKLPELFRDIFKSAFLPYREPEVLYLFLKEIEYFDYSHSEELGNAYEYLLSIMGSQGDAGQFRTPRHIIDFIVKVVNPTKDDKILDPACGTAGFLISAYKHILDQHDGKNEDGSKNAEKPLTPTERKNLRENFEGYDIDPTMVRISQVNAYLHGFKQPKIFNYNSLASEERWNDKFDVILANPPFMSPKGGVRPHKKFGVESNRAEVLFVDYIMSHLKPKGRAGVIVPEGIIFQSGNAYKQLRKNLVEDGLFAVVSLPSGVFYPYSGVKTSILFFDNEVADKTEDILFVRVLNDGFDLNAQRRPRPDLPNDLDMLGDQLDAKKAIKYWREHVLFGAKWSLPDKNSFAWKISKEEISKTGDYSLSGDRYRVATDYTNAKWPIVKFDTVVTTITPPTKILKENYKNKGDFPVIDQSQVEIAGWTNDESALVKSEKPLVIFGDHTCVVKYVDKSFAQGADGIKILLTNDQLVPKFLYYLLNKKPIESEGYQRHFTKLRRYEIPLPPLEIQEQIVAELDGYAGIISGAKQIAKNWKPRIEIDPEWEKVKIESITTLVRGSSPRPQGDSRYYGGTIPRLMVSDVTRDGMYTTPKTDFLTEEGAKLSRLMKKGDVVMAVSGNPGLPSILSIDACIHDGFVGFRALSSKLLPEFLYFVFLHQQEANNLQSVGAVFKNLTTDQIKQFEIPIPPLNIQKQIVEKIEAEGTLVESAKKLIEIYEQKTKEVIAKLWSE